jgi:hypothetical protein
MGSKRPDRRELLKSGAALAGGLTLGAVAPVSGQTPTSTPVIKGSKELIAYGEPRSVRKLARRIGVDSPPCFRYRCSSPRCSDGSNVSNVM